MKATLFLLPLLGVTWIIGILAVNNDTVAFAWIFAILNSLQVMKVCFYKYFQVPFNLGCLHIYIPSSKKQKGDADLCYK